MPYYFKALQVFLLAMIKYFYAPIYGVAIGLGFWWNYFALMSGGLIGFYIYYYFSRRIINMFRWIGQNFRKLKSKNISTNVNPSLKKSHPSKIIFKRNRWIVKLKHHYGMWGIVILTPVLLSLPIGAFLLRKYYSNNKKALPLMFLSIIVEGFVLCLAYYELAKI